MRSSESLFLEVRRLRYHVRRWTRHGAPKLFLLHGWMDVSASFQFLVDALAGEWDIFAPDWRGYGLSQWGNSDCYWFPDYIADLDALLGRLEPHVPVNLVGHSLGGNVALLYAGIRPARVARLVNLEGVGLPATRPEQAPKRYVRWLDELRDPPQLKSYESFAALADRLQKANPRLWRERAEYLAHHWGRDAGDGRIVLRGDAAHKIVNPVLYRYEEVRACWEQVSAPVLWLDAAHSDTLQRLGIDAAQYADRRRAVKHLTYMVVEGSGHMLHHDQPEKVASLIEAFLLG